MRVNKAFISSFFGNMGNQGLLYLFQIDKKNAKKTI
jgi:hypothetical protein